MVFYSPMAPPWSPKLLTLPCISMGNPKFWQSCCYRSERWFIFRPLSRSSASHSLAALRCRATMEDAPVVALTLRDICRGKVPQHILKRAEEVGYVMPTDVQQKSIPVLLSGQDCVLHAQTGSGKTLAYLLLIFSAINFERSAVQAVIIVPTRELGMQVTKVARMLVAKPAESDNLQRACTIMPLLDGGMLRRHKRWLKVDFMFNSSKQVYALRRLLTFHSTIESRQTVFASASIPQHNRFIYDCVQHKWTKNDVVHIHVNPIQPMPSHLHHSFVICGKTERLSAVLYLLQRDTPRSAIVFVSEQSEKSKKAGRPPSAALLFEFLKLHYNGSLELNLIEEDMNFNARATSLSDIRQRGFLLVATDLASRGFDLPQTTHIYNFDLPKTAVDYLHRAGRTGRLPFSSSDEFCVASLVAPEELFVLQRFQNELMFKCKERVLGPPFTPSFT